MLTGFCREKYDGSIGEKFQSRANQGLVILNELVRVRACTSSSALLFGRGFFLCGFESEIPFIQDDDHGAAGLLGVACDGGVVRGDADGGVSDVQSPGGGGGGRRGQ